MHTINMLSRAESVKGQGVLSAYEEQVRLVKEELADEFVCYINRPGLCDIMHYHTINPEFFALRQMSRGKSVSVGYVHFLPETVDNSPEPAAPYPEDLLPVYDPLLQEHGPSGDGEPLLHRGSWRSTASPGSG